MVQHLLYASLELWGGIECTLNRVKNSYFDQISRSGHDRREDDLDRIAALGITTLRYPLLWERVAPRGPASANWPWADQRMDRLRSLRIRPIIANAIAVESCMTRLQPLRKRWWAAGSAAAGRRAA